MKTTWASVTLVLAALLATTGIQAANTANPAQAAVAALEQSWLKAQQTNNYDALEASLADNIVQTSIEGKVTTTKSAALADSKSVKWASVDYSDMKFFVYGDTVVAIGNFRGKGTDSTGAAVDERAVFTDTWVKMPDGKWQCVASHATAYKKR
ncbi:MAG TPA: nuclear transport factor 2 family protein [Steroidobacteraceae bacterium]|jgi:ketosteroid isomerase-like protein